MFGRKKLPKDRIRTKARSSWDEESKNKGELVPRNATNRVLDLMELKALES
jgi:hypothetical protein